MFTGTVAETVDGRVTRGQRNREAIIDALLACYEAGNYRPSVHEVATRAGVSARSVHNHFEDVEALRAEVAQRQSRHFDALLAPLPAGMNRAARIDAVVASRAETFEAISPVRQAALLSVHDSPTIASNLARLSRRLRRALDDAFPGLDADTLDALDAALSWDTWSRLRAAQGCSITRAQRVLTLTVTALLEGSPT
jgi:AcrR family transcriptional regulator